VHPDKHMTSMRLGCGRRDGGHVPDAARATDIHGLLRNAERAMTGVLTDTRAPGKVHLCNANAGNTCASDGVRPDNIWAIFVPPLGNGVTTRTARRSGLW
jgi:hypothetical protein